MHVTYKPEDGTPQEWEFNPGRVRAGAAEVIEKRFGDSWEKFCAAVQQGSMRARRVLLWHLLTREHPGLRLEDVPDFYADEVVVEHSVAELTELRERLDKADLPEDQRVMTHAAFDLAMSEAMAREERLGQGKALSAS